MIHIKIKLRFICVSMARSIVELAVERRCATKSLFFTAVFFRHRSSLAFSLDASCRGNVCFIYGPITQSLTASYDIHAEHYLIIMFYYIISILMYICCLRLRYFFYIFYVSFV